MHSFAPLWNRSLISKFSLKIAEFFAVFFQKISQKKKEKKKKSLTAKNSAISNENFEISIFRQWIPKRCKGVHCVDLGESFPTSIYLQNLASIQPRTSPVKFARSPRTDPPGRDRGTREALEAGAVALPPGGLRAPWLRRPLFVGCVSSVRLNIDVCALDSSFTCAVLAAKHR